MKRIPILLALLLGCSTDGTGDDDLPPSHPPPGQADEDEDADFEECRLGAAKAEAICPSWWGRIVRHGPGSSDPDPAFVELEDVAEPVCNGLGLFAEPEDFEGAPGGPEVTIVRNEHCSVVCFPQCAFTSVCYAANPSGRACGHACTVPGDMTEAECEAFVAECLGDPSACG